MKKKLQMDLDDGNGDGDGDSHSMSGGGERRDYRNCLNLIECSVVVSFFTQVTGFVGSPGSSWRRRISGAFEPFRCSVLCSSMNTNGGIKGL